MLKIYLAFFLLAYFNMILFAFNSKISSRIIRKNIQTHTLKMSSDERIFGGSYNIYKSKAAICIKPILPTFKGDGSTRNLVKDGALLFEFAPSTGTNAKEYDWTKKIVFSVSINECGELLRFKEGAQGVLMDFAHDPGLGSSEAGSIMKKMKWTATPDGKGMFLGISIYDKNNAAGSANLSIPVSWGEFEIIKTIVQFCIPRFLGLDKQFESNLVMLKTGSTNPLYGSPVYTPPYSYTNK